MDGTITETTATHIELPLAPTTTTRSASSSPTIPPKSPISSLIAPAEISQLVIEQNPDLVQINTTNFIKNKRKNFSPRCSSVNDDETPIADDGDIDQPMPSLQLPLQRPSTEQQYTPPPTTISECQLTLSKILINSNNSIKHKMTSNSTIIPSSSCSSIFNSGNLKKDETDSNNSSATTISMNWRKLLETHHHHQHQQQQQQHKHHHYHHHHHYQQQHQRNDRFAINTNYSDPIETTQRSASNRLDDFNKQFYKIPNTNFTITKSHAISDSGGNNSNQQQTITATSTPQTATSHADPQSKIEFAYNAFNAVQELLNVYGLSISPGDIVDAFKKQQQNVGGCPQPPTPPRTPISSAIVASTTAISNGQQQRNQQQHHQQQQMQQSSVWCNNQNDDLDDEYSEDIQRSSTPLITLASVSKLAAQPTPSIAAHHKQNSNQSSSLIQINNNSNNNHNSQSNCSNDDFGDESTTIDDDDDDIGEQNKRNIINNHHDYNHHSNSNFSDRDDESGGNLYDLNRCFNDDSNVSSTDDPGSDDIGICGSSGGCGGDGSGTAGGVNNNSSNIARLSVKNVENLLDKCSLNFFSPMLQLAQMQNEDKQLHTESMKYLTRFSSYLECKTDTCQLENLREHYHCYDLPCLGKTLSKKEEIIRHLKWHKKRAESLNHGFLRFSSSDDCSATFGTNCTHNRKQTHYHCFQPNCDKVYISTSDVQMHSNYHRKDSAIYQEGFQRFRATEECNADYCMFAGQRTTHFHCRRDNCRYTFKNKADMEKHKSYHIKDLQLARDGFKKFLKTESCPYERCRFSRICNHIHCVRENCHYVLHSSGQLLSHKRKHERMDSEQAYRRFKMVQKATVAGLIASGGSSQDLSQQFGSSKPSTPSTSSSTAISPDLQIPSDLTVSFASRATADSMHPAASQSSPVDLSVLYNNANLPLEFLQQIHQRQQQLFRSAVDDQNFLQSTTVPGITPLSSSSTSVVDEIEQMIRQYFTDNCSRQQTPSATSGSIGSDQLEPLNLKNSIDPGKMMQDRVECFMTTADSHLHCLIKNCEAVVPRSLSDITEHMRMHELNRNAESIMQNSNLLQITSIEGFFNRKRGRPPKNRVVEVYNNAQHLTPQAIFTSFKLEKTLNEPQMLSPMTSTANTSRSSCTSTTVAAIAPSKMESHGSSADSATMLSTHWADGKIQIFHDAEKCCAIENLCIFSQQMHFHCKFSVRCHFATKYARAMERHLHEFHAAHRSTGDCFESMPVDNCEYFDQSIDCRVFGCSNSRINGHFHCIKCQFSTFSQAEIERHVTTACGQRKSSDASNRITVSTASSSNNMVNNLLNNINNDNSSEVKAVRADDIHQQQQDHHDEAMNVSIEKSGKDPDLDCSLVKSESSEDEKVSVVRAAGTYFPQNSENTPEPSSLSSCSQIPSTAILLISQTSQSAEPGGIIMCQRPFCKLKKKLHQHCELCNQAFSDKIKLKIHWLKHSTTRLGHLVDSEKEVTSIKTETSDDQPQDLTKQLQSPSPPLLSLPGASPSSSSLQPILPQNFVDNFSMQNIHLAHLALYQQNPFYYQNFYPFLGSQNLPAIAHAELLQSQFVSSGEQSETTSGSVALSSAAGKLLKTGGDQSTAFPFAAVAAVAAASSSSTAAAVAAAAAAAAGGSSVSGSTGAAGANVGGTSVCQFELPNISHEIFASIAASKQKRKSEDYGNISGPAVLMDMGMQPAKKMHKTNKHGNFKIFKDEPIPHGYLKFRFNEDCNFPNCGYRNHQSHFHCCRNDCYYSFCDKTRFVQHTARHERLDKLMGDDFKQYRANMRCGYEDCAYNKNLGQNNKSSHFHCLKCSFICSDTNKVVAHRRQHSKMEFIRMAGFRKIANNEKCTTSVGTAGEPDGPSTIAECTYSLKQTHYHCLVCDCSVLSRAQLGSHRHRVQ